MPGSGVSAVDGNDLAHVPEGHRGSTSERCTKTVDMWFDLRCGDVELGSRTSTWDGSLLQIGWMFIRLAIRCGVSRGGMLEESDLATTSLPVLRYWVGVCSHFSRRPHQS